MDHRRLSRQHTRKRQQLRPRSRPAIIPHRRLRHGKLPHVPPPPMPLLRTLESTSTHANLLRQPRPSAQTQLLLHTQASPSQVRPSLRIRRSRSVVLSSARILYLTRNSPRQRTPGPCQPLPKPTSPSPIKL
jgi:hypothetical protein